VWRVITPHTLAQSGREFIGYVERYHTENSGTVLQRFVGFVGVITPKNVAQSGREFVLCMVRYYAT